MRLYRKLSIITLLLSLLISLNVYAMNIDGFKIDAPQDKKNNGVSTVVNRWLWLDDGICVRFDKAYNRSSIEMQYDTGTLTTWREYKDGKWGAKTRDTYSGKWSQSEDGIWSFTFDDYTIPVGVTKIDDVLYAFNAFGELKADYEYYEGYKTEADGLVTADSAEFTQWLGTQYLPDCTSRK